jgi:hypothetical protein
MSRGDKCDWCCKPSYEPTRPAGGAPRLCAECRAGGPARMFCNCGVVVIGGAEDMKAHAAQCRAHAHVECQPMEAGENGWSEWIHPLPGYLMQCCDCGSVHEMQTAIVEEQQVAGSGAFNEGEDEGHITVFRMRRAALDPVTLGSKLLAQELRR